jgi:hypothetical protein
MYATSGSSISAGTSPKRNADASAWIRDSPGSDGRSAAALALGAKGSFWRSSLERPSALRYPTMTRTTTSSSTDSMLVGAWREDGRGDKRRQSSSRLVGLST